MPEVTQEQVQALMDDARYLEDEAEALKYVIEQVPYTEVPPGNMSILQRLALIDHSQHKYYRPLIEKIFANTRPLKIQNIEHYRDTFDFPDDEKDVQKILNKIIKHRAALLNLFDKIPLIDWEREVIDPEGRSITLYQFARKLIEEERQSLKEIADLVMIYQNNKLTNREANARAESRNKREG